MRLSSYLFLAAPLAYALPTADSSPLAKRSDNLFSLANSLVGSFITALSNAETAAEHAVKTLTTKKTTASGTFQSWKTFKANGVNLGGWLVMEKGIDPAFFNQSGAAAAIDEDSFCHALGPIKCGLALEKRYLTYFTFKDIDTFASYGINTLRIPIGYWAFMPAVNGDHYHTGGQLVALTLLSQYAISKGMHIIIDLHGLPGGQNGLDNQGKTGALDWWNNSTNMAYTLKTVDLATSFILAQPHSNQFTLGLINEPLPLGPQLFGQNDDSFAYLNKYYNAALTQIRKRTTSVPVMLSDGFSGAQTWDQWWANSTQNIVFDTHIYFFTGGSYSYDASYSACYLAKSYQAATNPVFIGEWSIQAAEFNHLGDDTRKIFFQTQWNAFRTFLQGGAFWNGKHNGVDVVGDDGSTQPYYWSWEQLASEGIVPKVGDNLTAVTC